MKKLAYILLVLVFVSCKNKGDFQLNSPNGKISLQITSKDGNLFLSQLYQGDTVILDSPVGLQVDDTDFTRNIIISEVEESTFDETWKTVIGKNKEVRNHYNESIFHLNHKENNNITYEMVFRCYDDGFAYRYIIHNFKNDSININGELSRFIFKDDFNYWAYTEERENIGPLKRSESPNSSIKIPMILELKDGLFMAIHEAEMVRYAPLRLRADGSSTDLKINLEKTKDGFSIKTSWRSFLIGKQPGDLIESNLLVNLNEPCKIEDTSWIKSGKSLWDWRVWGYKAKDGFEYGLNTVSHKRLIDFAAKNNIQYLLIDANWYGPEFNENSDPTAAKDGINIDECMAYAKEKGVGVFLYLNDVGAKKFGLERVLKQFSEWGAVGIKYGFMKGSWEEKVRHTRKVTALCAKYHLMVNFHDDPVPPSGDRRTFPNMLAKEYCLAQVDGKYYYFPETAVSSPFINMVAGPLDYTDGWFDLNNAHLRKRVYHEIPGTVTAEVAKLIIAFTGVIVLPDSPEEYLKKDDLFDCIRKIPAQFDSYKVLSGKIGDHIVVARKSGKDWFIGALTNREARGMTLNLDFLEKGEKYIATVYSDAEETHFLNNKESYKIEELSVNADSKLKIRMAPGGGCAIYIQASM